MSYLPIGLGREEGRVYPSRFAEKALEEVA